jgi:hypothetical protein
MTNSTVMTPCATDTAQCSSRAPNPGLRIMLSGLSTLPVREVMAALSPEDSAMVIDLFCRMRSGQGFLNDPPPTPDATGGGRPAHARDRHPQRRRRALRPRRVPRCRHPPPTLVQSQADTHLIWLGHDWPTIADRIRDFLTTEPPHPPSTAPHP